MRTRMLASLIIVLGLALVLAWAMNAQGAQANSTARTIPEAASAGLGAGLDHSPQDLTRLGYTLTFTPVSTNYLPLALANYTPGLLYSDDYSDPNSGWSAGEDEWRKWGYLNGEYQFYLKNTESSWLVTPDLVLPSDYRIEVDARQASSNASSYGLAFGIDWAVDTYEAYQFIVFPASREFLLEQRKMDGSWVLLIDVTYHPAINGGTASNHMTVDRVGTDIYLYINGTLVGALTDSSFTGSGRDAGVRAYSYDRAPVDVRFDNFSVSRPRLSVPLYADDFSDPGSGWVTDDDGNIRWSYQAGEYEMLLREKDWWAGVTSPIAGGLSSCAIEADMRHPSGHTSVYGLIFGHVDWDRFYKFLVNPDTQQFGIWRHTSTGGVAIVGWTSSSHINPAAATNRLRVERDGSEIRVYANGHRLWTAGSSMHLGSLGVGLYAESGDHANDIVRFDNFQFDRLVGTAVTLDGSMVHWTQLSASGGPVSVRGD